MKEKKEYFFSDVEKSSEKAQSFNPKVDVYPAAELLVSCWEGYHSVLNFSFLYVNRNKKACLGAWLDSLQTPVRYVVRMDES